MHLERTGRVEAIWFPFTDVPWLKVWSVAPAKSLPAKQIDTPYPYTFASRVTEDMPALLGEIAAGGGDKTPDFTKLATPARRDRELCRSADACPFHVPRVVTKRSCAATLEPAPRDGHGRCVY